MKKWVKIFLILGILILSISSLILFIFIKKDNNSIKDIKYCSQDNDCKEWNCNCMNKDQNTKGMAQLMIECGPNFCKCINKKCTKNGCLNDKDCKFLCIDENCSKCLPMPSLFDITNSYYKNYEYINNKFKCNTKNMSVKCINNECELMGSKI